MIKLPEALRPALIALLVFALASPLAAYTIYLKDGSKIIARDKYRIQGEKAYITLQNGTEAVYPAAEIDTQRTQEANVGNYGTALVVEEGKVREVPVEEVPRRDQPSLRDLITRGAAGPSSVNERPSPTRRPEPLRGSSGVEIQRTPAGYLDLPTLSRQRVTDTGLVEDLSRQFQRRELEDVRIFQGTAADRLLVEVIAGSEASVFRAVATAASALLQLRERDPSRVVALELLLTTPNGQRAGQFIITPEAAEELIARKIDLASFFLRYVEF